MRKLFVAADIEGCAGVASQHALSSDRWEWSAARRWMTLEVLAACEAAFEAGYDEVLVADGHGNAHNIDPDMLPDRVRLIRSWPRPFLQMEGVQDPEADACFFIGNHNGSMGSGGILAHTYHGGAYRDLRVNGVSVSEGWLNAALAGEFGKPVLLVTGDEQTAEDARRYAPGAVTCVVKQAIGWRAQAALSPSSAQRAIREAAAAALAAPRPQPFRVAGPYRLELEMTSRGAAEMLAYLPGVELAGPFTAAIELPTLAETMRFVSFAMLYSPTGVMAL